VSWRLASCRVAATPVSRSSDSLPCLRGTPRAAGSPRSACWQPGVQVRRRFLSDVSSSTKASCRMASKRAHAPMQFERSSARGRKPAVRRAVRPSVLSEIPRSAAGNAVDFKRALDALGVAGFRRAAVAGSSFASSACSAGQPCCAACASICVRISDSLGGSASSLAQVRGSKHRAAHEQRFLTRVEFLLWRDRIVAEARGGIRLGRVDRSIR